MKKLFIAIVMLGSTLMLYAAKADKKVTITVGNESREYWLYVPNNVKAEAPLFFPLRSLMGGVSTRLPSSAPTRTTSSPLAISPSIVVRKKIILASTLCVKQ